MFLDKVNTVTFHHSFSHYGNAEIIDEWHRERGFTRIGYHYVVLVDGVIESGREISYMGAHDKGHNGTSLGICLIGDFSKSDPFEAQYEAAAKLYAALCLTLGKKLKIKFHRKGKNACPGLKLDRQKLMDMCQKEAGYV